MLAVSQLIDLTEQRYISLVSSFLSYRELRYKQYTTCWTWPSWSFLNLRNTNLKILV